MQFAPAVSTSAMVTMVRRPRRRRRGDAVLGTRRPDLRRCQPEGALTTSITAQVGHWSESDEFLDEVARRLGGDPDRDTLRATAREAARRLEALAGRTFGQTGMQTQSIDSGGLPLVPVDDVQIATLSAEAQIWPIPDPANSALASVLQLRPPPEVAARAASDGEGFRAAGTFVARAHRAGRLSGEYVLEQLRPLFAADVREEDRLRQLQRIADPSSHVHVPLAATYAGGWWMQLSRELLVVTRRTPHDHRVVVPLDDRIPLVATEPVLILARLTAHPIDRAFSVRIWASGTPAAAAAPWRIAAAPIHRYGIPILTLDDASTNEEIACQMVLLAYWHGYLGRDEPALADVIAAAYPRAVARVRAATDVPDNGAAAALLLVGLFRPGFDPVRGAHNARKYVSRQATIAVLEHRKATRVGLRPWEHLGVSERYYYKLLHRFGRREGRRWHVNDDARRAIEAYLRASKKRRDVHTAAMSLLQQRGFRHNAARKWLQRHPIQYAVDARPREGRTRPITAPRRPAADRHARSASASPS